LGQRHRMSSGQAVIRDTGSPEALVTADRKTRLPACTSEPVDPAGHDEPGHPCDEKGHSRPRPGGEEPGATADPQGRSRLGLPRTHFPGRERLVDDGPPSGGPVDGVGTGSWRWTAQWRQAPASTSRGSRSTELRWAMSLWFSCRALVQQPVLQRGPCGHASIRLSVNVAPLSPAGTGPRRTTVYESPLPGGQGAGSPPVSPTVQARSRFRSNSEAAPERFQGAGINTADD
jgi:hypothetical protein